MRKFIINQLLAWALFVLPLTIFAQGRADSLKKLYQPGSADTVLLPVITQLTEFYSETQPDSSLKYAELLMVEAKKRGYQIDYGLGLIYKAYALTNKGNYPAALKIYQDALKYLDNKDIESKVLPARFYQDNEFAWSNADAKQMRLSLLGMTNQFLGILYGNTNNAEKELQHYHKSIDILKAIKSQRGLLVTYLTLGRVYLSLHKTDSALMAEEYAYKLVHETGYEKYVGSILLNLGRIQNEMGNTEKAMTYFREAIIKSEQQDYLRGAIAARLYMADIFTKLGDGDSANYYQREALKVAEVLNSASLLLRCYNALARYYRSTPQKDSIIKYQGLVIQLNDSLFNEKQFQQFENIEADAEQQRLEMAAAKKEYKQRFQNSILLGGLIAILAVALLLSRNIRQRQKANAKLKQQKTELEATLEELKNTQAQLIQAEKMASLGELTAGIAHEIQNPLNFVNNFSELNKELIGEMKTELQEGRLDEVKRISESIEDNETKILSHGQRADAIVKSMLQHSRTNTGKKEAVNINNLIDEYVRLAYHGWRAKDKSFNTKLETSYDPTLPLIEVVPQDFARVILNLVNNAFYTVNEKRMSITRNYEPTVKITTRNLDNRCEVTIADNGAGMPQKLVDKIFQPFFTTKPTGQGTGLGLSLSYDIIKSHGGDISVNTKESEGTEFIITLMKK
jgi:signal transduction histidine kinase